MPRSLSALVIASRVVAQFFGLVDDQQKIGRELVGGSDLDLPAAQPCRGDVRTPS
jgi:hypothetical protein